MQNLSYTISSKDFVIRISFQGKIIDFKVESYAP